LKQLLYFLKQCLYEIYVVFRVENGIKRKMIIKLTLAFFVNASLALHAMEQATEIETAIQSDQVSQHSFSYTQRPEEIQRRIDAIFEQIKTESIDHWYYNGSYFKAIGGFEHDRYLFNILQQSAPNSEVNYLDLGAGIFRGGEQLIEDLMGKPEILHHIQTNNIKFRVIGVSGEYVPPVSILHADGLIEEHRYGGIKIENIVEELKRIDKNFSFDVVFSSWCLRHLVDPLGTYDQVMHILKNDGLFILNGFFTIFDEQSRIYEYVLNMCNILEKTGPFLFYPNSTGDDLGCCIVRRSSFYSLPLAYTRELYRSARGDQVGSGLISKYDIIGSLTIRKDTLGSFKIIKERLPVPFFFGDGELLETLYPYFYDDGV
jgi:hypothetical protein